ncbi:MAG TPA: ATP-binding protein [Xanthomonadales bacterium]|nr:ATP-binding protein [Xanthomonadales bacterium]
MNAQHPGPDAIAAMQAELEELRETLRAIRSGEVDAIVVDGSRIYTLETAERPYRVFLEAMQEGAVTTGPEGTILYCNMRFANMLGAPAARLLGCRLRDLVLEADAERVDRLLSAGDATSGEVRLRTPGEPLVAQLSVSRLEVDGLVASCIVVTDLSEAKRVEQALREAGEVLEQRVAERTRELSRSEQRFRSLVTATTAIIWSTDAGGGFATPQWSWQAYTGHAWEKHRGWGWAEALHPEDRDATLASWRDSLVRRAVYEASARIWHGATRGWRHCNIRAVPVLDADGAVREWVGSCEDVDDARRAEEALRESEHRLKQDDRRKDEFIATLAHELRNPLAPIRSAAKILEVAGAERPQTRWAHEVIGRQVAQMARLLDDLLDVSRITQDKLELKRERVQLADVVRSAIETSMPLIREQGCELAVELPGEPLALDADPTRLSQILLNLLNNAAKYNHKGGRIAVSARRAGAEVEVVVADSGIGITPEAMPRIFDMFAQVEDARKRARGGLGIGLALVRRLAQMHGGTVTARSDGAERGSEFVLRLPLAAERAPAEPAAARDGQGRRETYRIVVADDNQDAAESLAMLLGLEGHEVRTVYDGEQAVDEVERFAPHIVLLDIGMPQLDGYQAAARIRARDGGLRPTLIALTGWGQEQDKQRARQAGFDHHLTKPVDLDALLGALKCAAAPVPCTGD